MHLEFGSRFVFVNKPAGISTHAADTHQLGMAELTEAASRLSPHSIEKIYVIHRLDQSTTGALAFATSSADAAQAFELFKQHQVKKRYLLITDSFHHFLQDKNDQMDEFEVHSHIEKTAKGLVQTLTSPEKANAHTRFRRLKGNALFQQWEAFPTTGKPHQIRLHAAAAKIPILGDTTYGGSNYPHLCLHAAELEIPGEKKWLCPAPVFFDRMGLLRDHTLVKWLSAIDRRLRLFDFLKNKEQMFRLIHTEGGPLRLEMLGSHLWFQWYSDEEPSGDNLERIEFIAGLLGKPYIVRKMQNRGQDSKSAWEQTSPDLPSTWIANEGSLKFEMRRQQGLSAGLFLDQRENRREVLLRSRHKKVLNLFSYTGGFSVAAAVGGARQVTTVDLSKAAIEWSRRNFSLNQLPVEDHEFFATETFEFLKTALKKKRSFDLIICDPPSFGRHGSKVFRLEKDFAKLIDLCWQLLSPKGQILFSSNLEKWSWQNFEKEIKKALPTSKVSSGYRSLDFEELRVPSLTKSFFIEKK